MWKGGFAAGKPQGMDHTESAFPPAYSEILSLLGKPHLKAGQSQSWGTGSDLSLCSLSPSQIPNSQSQTASPSRDLPNLPFIYLFIPQALLPSLGNKSMVKTPIKHGEIRISAKRLEKEIPAFPRCHKELGRGEGAVKIPKFIPKTLSFLISIQGWLWRHFQGNNSQRIWDKSKYFICFSSGIPLWTSPSHPWALDSRLWFLSEKCNWKSFPTNGTKIPSGSHTAWAGRDLKWNLKWNFKWNFTSHSPACSQPLEKWRAANSPGQGKIWEKKFPLQAATGNPQPLLREREKKIN